MTPYYARATAAVGVDLAGGPCGGWTVEEIVAASDALSAKTAAREHLEARVDPKAISIRQPGAGRHYFLTCVTVLRRSRSAIQVSLGTCRLSFRNDPRQYCLHRRDAWIIRLSDDRKQLKPQIIVGMFDEFANCTRGKIRHRHGRRSGAALELPRYARIQRRQDAGCDSGLVKLRDEFSEHVALVL